MRHSTLLLLQLIFFAVMEIHPSERTILNGIDFGSKIEFSLPKGNSKKTDKLDAAAGFKVSLKNADLRLYESLSTEVPATMQALSDGLGSPRYGFGITLFGESVPTTIKAGKNSHSKSLSKIKNPSPSTAATPLRQSFAFSTGIHSSLPTLSSAEQPLSATLNIGIPKNSVLDGLSIDALVDEKMDTALSASAEKRLGKLSSMHFALTGARFFIENGSAVLKKSGAEFRPDYYLSGLAEFSLRTPIVKANARIGAQESPYNANPVWLSLECRTGYRNVISDFSFFAVPTSELTPRTAPLIGANSSIQRTLTQIGISPQTVFLLGSESPAAVRLGAHAIAARKITSTKNAEMMDVGKIRVAESFESKRTTVRHDLTVANILISGNPPNKTSTPEKYVTNSISVSRKSSKLNMTADISHKHVPPYSSSYPATDTFTSMLTATPGLSKTLSASGKVSLTFKDARKSGGEFSFLASCKFKSKKASASLKCGVEIPF